MSLEGWVDTKQNQCIFHDGVGISYEMQTADLTQGLLTYACHWLARVEAEWGDKTSWKECTCRSAVGQSDWRVHWCGPAPVEVQEEYTPL